MKKFWKEYFLFQKEPSPGWSRGQRELYYAYRVALLLCAGLCMGLALLVLAIGPYPRGTLVDYLCHWQTLRRAAMPPGRHSRVPAVPGTSRGTAPFGTGSILSKIFSSK